MLYEVSVCLQGTRVEPQGLGLGVPGFLFETKCFQGSDDQLAYGN